MDITLWPWQRIPRSWVCAECQRPATTYFSGDGVLILGCDEHRDILGDILMDRFSLGAIGGGRVRHPWGYWTHTRFYILKRTLWPSERRWIRQRHVEQARIAEIFKDFWDDRPSIIERFR